MDKKLLSVVVAALMAVSLMPLGLADTPTVNTGLGISVDTEDFVPRVFMYPERFISHNNADLSECGILEDPFSCYLLIERVENYAFEGEQLHWLVIVWDKNGDDKIKDVSVNIQSDYGQEPGYGDVEANCDELQMDPEWFDGFDHEEVESDDGLALLHFLIKASPWGEWIKECQSQQDCSVWDAFYDRFNVRELEEDVPFNSETMNMYLCTLTVEPYNDALGMYGEYFVYVEAEDLSGNFGTFDENEYWFFNPEIALEIVGDGIDFGDVRPGSNAYSDTLLIRNAAEFGSGVLLDMGISGTDFYDPLSSGAKCPTTNQLALRNLAYYATNGNYETGHNATTNDRLPVVGGDEGYFSIPYEVGNEAARLPIIEGDGIILLGTAAYPFAIGEAYQGGNVLSPGAEIALTFRLALPEPCNGDFSEGQIYFWGEAI